MGGVLGVRDDAALGTDAGVRGCHVYQPAVGADVVAAGVFAADRPLRVVGGVLQPKGLEDPLAIERLDALATGPSGDQAEDLEADVRVVVVRPRLGQQRLEGGQLDPEDG